MDELRNLDWQEILNYLENSATSEVGKDSLRTLAPLPSTAAAEQSFAIIAEAQEILNGGDRPHSTSLDLYPSWYSRLQKGACLKTLELKDVRSFFLECIALREVLSINQGPWATSLKQRLMKADEPLSAIDHVITANGEIRSDASNTLQNLFQEKQSLSRRIHSVLDRLVKANPLEDILQDRYVTNREGRWVLPVKGGMQHEFPGIIHGSSHSKQTVFMEPQDIIPLNNRLREIEVEIEAEIQRILTELSDYLSRLGHQISESRTVLLDADINFAKANLSRTLKAHPCRFNNESLQLNRVRHPILVLQNSEVIANSVDLKREAGILLLSGPNAGGKTVLLKAVGLAAQMARCGLPICAETDSQLPFFKSIISAIGDAQSVDAHLSTFAAHLKVLSAATQLRGNDQLLLIDEICGSTDPEEGTALARSFIETYAKNQIFSVITSHLGPLKLGWESGAGVINGSLEYNTSTGHPTYHFLMGVPGQSLAIETASRVGVDKRIVERALDLLSPEAKAHHTAMADMESLRVELHSLQKRLEDELKAARKNKDKYQQLIDKFQREKELWLQRSVKRAEKKLDEVISHVKTDEIFRRHDKLQTIRHEFPEIVRTHSPSPESGRLESAEAFVQLYPPGTRIFIPSIGREGIIQGEPNGKGEIPILSQSMRLYIHWQQIEPPRASPNPTTKLLRKSGTGVQVGLHDSERAVDLRGKTIEDAIELLEVQLDRAALNGEERVKVIHGHGTDALKKAVRNHLSRSIYVQSWSAGGRDTGGDGVTWILIKD